MADVCVVWLWLGVGADRADGAGEDEEEAAATLVPDATNVPLVCWTKVRSSYLGGRSSTVEWNGLERALRRKLFRFACSLRMMCALLAGVMICCWSPLLF